MSESHILIVDDDAAMLQVLPRAVHLRLPGVHVHTCGSAHEAHAQVSQVDFDAIIIDVNTPGLDGLALLDRIRAVRSDTPVLLITAHSEYDLAVRALRGGAVDFIHWPIDRDYFVASLERAMQVRQLRRQADEQQRALATHGAQLESTLQERTHALQAAVLEQRDAHRQTEVLASQLAQKAAELDTIFESIVDGIFVCDAAGLITHVNSHGAELVGLTVEQTLRPIKAWHASLDLLYIDGSAVEYEEYPLVRAVQHGVTSSDSRYLLRQVATDTYIPIRFSCAPIRDAAGAITGAVGVASDISEMYRLERQKDEFLGIASHELKTPLTSLKGLTQLTRRKLERSNAPEAQHLARMEQAINRMETLVNDLLDVSRLESGKLALRLQRCDLTTLVRHVVDEHALTSERRFVVEAPSVPIVVDIDVDRVGQVLTNLLVNALKYSHGQSAIQVHVAQTEREALCTVRDSGVGIPPDELPHIFERFYRAPSIEVQSGSGVGLGIGLHIARELVERHGGRIVAESTPRVGSIFTFVLPLAPQPQTDAQAYSANSPQTDEYPRASTQTQLHTSHAHAPWSANMWAM